jgi:dephospho-CoA kinase
MHKRIFVVGVTGGLCTGKTTASRYFASQGACVLDADGIAHLLMKKGQAAYKKIVTRFGKGILTRTGRIDRKKLAAIVFADKKKIAWLNACLHPRVKSYIARRLKEIAKKKTSRIAIVEAPLLIEARFLDLIDFLLVVRAPLALQIRRAARKLRIPPSQARARIARQMSIAKKIAHADIVINSEKGLKNFYAQLARVWREIEKRAQKCEYH